MNCKKRKPDTDGLALEAERSLHQSFVHAANAVSQLYTHALTHQHKRAHVDGARQVLVRRCRACPGQAGLGQAAQGVCPCRPCGHPATAGVQALRAEAEAQTTILRLSAAVKLYVQQEPAQVRAVWRWPMAKGPWPRHSAILRLRAPHSAYWLRLRLGLLHCVCAAAQERQVNWVAREYGNSASIPTSVLLSFLRQELQARCCARDRFHCAATPAGVCASQPVSCPSLPWRWLPFTWSRLAAGRRRGGDAVLRAGGRARLWPRRAPACGAPLRPCSAAARPGQRGWLSTGAILARLWPYALPRGRQPLRTAEHRSVVAKLASRVVVWVAGLRRVFP